MRIEYSPLPDITSRVVLAPLVPVTLTYGAYEFSTFALVDSGAAGAVISTVIADALNIDWLGIKPKGGFSVGGTFLSHRVEEVTADILGHQFPLALDVVEGIGPYKGSTPRNRGRRSGPRTLCTCTLSRHSASSGDAQSWLPTCQMSRHWACRRYVVWRYGASEMTVHGP